MCFLLRIFQILRWITADLRWITADLRWITADWSPKNDFFFIHFLDDSEHSKTNEHLNIFWYFWSDSLVNHRRLAVNHRRLVTKKKKWPSQKKIIFFLSIFWMNQSLLSPKKVVPNFFFFWENCWHFQLFFCVQNPLLG